jgi:hypothetical protein
MDVFSQCRAAGRAAVDAANQHTADHELKSIYDLAYNQAYEQARAKAHGGSSIRKRKTMKTRKIRRNCRR